MPARDAALLALCLVGAALAGCAQPPPPPPPAEEPAGDGGAQAGLVPSSQVANLTQPEEPSEFAKSLDEKFHTHNYWGGALEKVIMDEDVTSGELAPDPLGGPPAYQDWIIRTQAGRGLGMKRVYLPTGGIVPPETTRLEVTVTWASDPKITGLSLWYRDARGEGAEIVQLDPLPDGGGTYAIETNLTMNDIPHTIESKWRFWLAPENTLAPGMPGVFNGTAHVLIKAFRNDTLFVAPPHPDFWGDATTLDLFNHTGPIAANKAVVPLFLGPDSDDGVEFFNPPENVTIPPHTGVLTITVTWANNATLPDLANTHLELLYSPPNAFGFLAPDPSAMEDGRIVYTIPVDPRMWDSPYDNVSAWDFLLAVDSDAATDLGYLGDLAFFEGSFLVAVVAEREPV